MLSLWAMFFSFEWIFAVGIAVLLHECAHLLACRALGIEVLGIKALPWGLTASTPIMHDNAMQFAVSVSGPMMNFFLLALCPFTEKFMSKNASELFALANLADGLLNLIPALPLDGGIILKSFLCSRCGLVRGFEHMIKITVTLSLLIMIWGIHIFFSAGGNISYFMAGSFMMYNIRHEKELVMCLKKRVLTGEIVSKPPVKRICAESTSNAICMVDIISPSYTMIISVTEDGKEKGLLHQNKLLECVLKNSTVTIGECIEKR